IDPPGDELLDEIVRAWPGKPRAIRHIGVDDGGALQVQTTADDIDAILEWLFDPIDIGVSALGAMGDEYERRSEQHGEQQERAQESVLRWFKAVQRHQH